MSKTYSNPLCSDPIGCLLCTEPSCSELDCDFPKKDRSLSRRRHLNDLKAQKRAKTTATILEAKYRRLSIYATNEEDYVLSVRGSRAAKKAKWIVAKEEKQTEEQRRIFSSIKASKTA